MNNIELMMRAIEEEWTRIDILRAEKTPNSPAIDSCLTETDKLKQQFSDSSDTTEICEWCKKSCHGHWTMFGGQFYFKNESDATLFSLRWQ